MQFGRGLSCKDVQKEASAAHGSERQVFDVICRGRERERERAKPFWLKPRVVQGRGGPFLPFLFLLSLLSFEAPPTLNQGLLLPLASSDLLLPLLHAIKEKCAQLELIAFAGEIGVHRSSTVSLR